VKDQPGIEQKFEASFEACEALQEFAEAHRPGPVSHEASLIVAGTIARSAAAFKCIIKLCRMGYGDQASMLNRSFFEDMISAHWATLYPKRAARLLKRHDDWVRVHLARVRKRHNIAYELSTPLHTWTGSRKKRLRKLFGRGSWTGRPLPTMVKQVKPLWPDEASAERLQRTYDLFHRGNNILLHYSARSLQQRVDVNPDGSYSFNAGPSEVFVASALGFAFWTYANTISLGVTGDDESELAALARKYDAVVPDRHLPFEANRVDWYKGGPLLVFAAEDRPLDLVPVCLVVLLLS